MKMFFCMIPSKGIAQSAPAIYTTDIELDKYEACLSIPDSRWHSIRFITNGSTELYVILDTS